MRDYGIVMKRGVIRLPAIFFLLAAAGAHAQVAQTKVCATNFGTGTCAFASPPSGGNTIIVTVEARSDGTQPTISSVASTNDTLANKNSNTSFPNTYIWCVSSIIGGANSQTLTITQASGTGNIRINIIMYEVNAASATCTVDKSTSAQGNSNAPNTGALATTATAHDFVVGVLGVNNGLQTCATNVGTGAPSNPTAGWTASCQGENGLGTQNTTAWLNPAGTGAYELAGSLSAVGNWSDVITAFTPGTVAGGGWFF